MKANNDGIQSDRVEKKAEIKTKMNERFRRNETPCPHTRTHTTREEQTKKKYQIEVQRMFARILYRLKSKSTTLFDCVIDNQWIFDALEMKTMTTHTQIEKMRECCTFTKSFDNLAQM